jgi:squalene-hopene/tetraprenyl-beta-curcumene cyclase
MTTTERTVTDTAALEGGLRRAVSYLLGRQDPAGWWQGELETNVTMEAEDLLLRQFLGVRTAEQTEQSARWIRSRQRGDGSWANFPGGPPDPSTTTEAYVALRLAGDAPDQPHMRAARDVVLEHGGIEQTRVFTRIWLALFGVWSWDRVPTLPPEMVLLPSSVPLNVYDFSCWARQTVVPLSILSGLRPCRDLGFGVPELFAPARTGNEQEETEVDRRDDGGNLGRGRLVGAATRAFGLLDPALRLYQRRPVPLVRGHALRRAAEWVIARQEADGSWGGIQPPWVYSLMALSALGYPNDHPVLARGLQGWERFTIIEETEAGVVRRLEACQSPVWDTALALVALGDAGVEPTHPAVRRAVAWLLQEEIGVPGDWSVRRPDAAPAGWAFEFDNDRYPDIDDTAEVVLALRHTLGQCGDPAGGTVPPAPGGSPVPAAIDRAVEWVEAMQCRDGGWAAFDVDNSSSLVGALPFCDFGAVTDPPSADVTAHVVEMLAREGRAGSTAATRGVRWLLDHQEADGSWFGRWGANHVYGVGAVVPALVAAGESPASTPVRRAVGWLLDHQNADGGWGEDLRSYEDSDWVGRGASTPSQTAWALLALEAAGEASSPEAGRAIEWLLDRQRDDGGWDEHLFTGTGFPGDFYIGYHLYRLVFPISALARCLRSAS